MRCERCGIACEVKNAYSGLPLDLMGFEIYFHGEKVQVCALCVGELRLINAREFDLSKQKINLKNLS